MANVDDNFLARLNPNRAINERPNADSLMELKMLSELAGNTGRGMRALYGPRGDQHMSTLVKNEMKYFSIALKILNENERVRQALGGATYENLSKLTRIVKKRHDELFVEGFLDSAILNKNIYGAGVTTNPFGLDISAFAPTNQDALSESFYVG